MIKPFKVDISEENLQNIYSKVKNYQWHEMPDDGGWNYIGIDVSEEYNQIARQRMETEVIHRKTDVTLSQAPSNPLSDLL